MGVVFSGPSKTKHDGTKQGKTSRCVEQAMQDECPLVSKKTVPSRQVIYSCAIAANFKGFTLIPASINNHIPSKVYIGSAYLFPNFNDYTVEVWKWMNDFIPRSIMGVITYLRPD